VDQGFFACFIPAMREKLKRAMALLSTDTALAAEFQAILDQCSAPWWDAATLWDRAKDRTADVFADYHPGAAPALLGQAA
jgi:hypothetical protein